MGDGLQRNILLASLWGLPVVGTGCAGDPERS